MIKLAPHFVWTLLFAGFLCGCNQDPSGVSDQEEVTIFLRVSGGFAGADYSVLLDGDRRTLTGVTCVSLCDFGDGELLLNLTRDQVLYMGELFRDAQIHAVDGTDFGVQCCDQFYYELEFLDSKGVSTVKGSSEAFPVDLRGAIAVLHGMVAGTVPLIVDLLSPRDPWVGDAYQVLNAGVQGDLLEVGVSFGGGCRAHSVRGVAWGGWMESNPVQVRLILSHEDFDDPCDAMISQDYRFHLGPLKSAYQDAYGIGEPGETTLIILLEDPRIAGPLGARWLEYRF